MNKKHKAALDARINRIYRERCSLVQIDIMDIGKVFQVAYQAVANDPTAAADDKILGDRIADFVEKIRRN